MVESDTQYVCTTVIRRVSTFLFSLKTAIDANYTQTSGSYQGALEPSATDVQAAAAAVLHSTRKFSFLPQYYCYP